MTLAVAGFTPNAGPFQGYTFVVSAQNPSDLIITELQPTSPASSSSSSSNSYNLGVVNNYNLGHPGAVNAVAWLINGANQASCTYFFVVGNQAGGLLLYAMTPTNNAGDFYASNITYCGQLHNFGSEIDSIYYDPMVPAGQNNLFVGLANGGLYSCLLNFPASAGAGNLINCNGYELIMQSDGNLVLYSSAGTELWASGTQGKSTVQALMQTDGNFVLYNAVQPTYQTVNTANTVWSSGTSGNSGAYLGLSSNGTLAVYNASGTPIYFLYNGSANGTSTQTVTINAGMQLLTTSCQIFNNGYQLILQNDGNLVVYNSAGAPVWASMTNGKGAVQALMQSDGNFVLYNAIEANGSENSANAVWASGTENNPGAYLGLGSNGNLAIYYSSGSAINILYNGSGNGTSTSTVTINNGGQLLPLTLPTFTLEASNTSYAAAGNNMTVQIARNTYLQNVLTCGNYMLVMQSDGNLALYNGYSPLNTSVQTPVWTTGTSGKTVLQAVMQEDGNFVLYNVLYGASSSNAVWASNTYGNSGAYLSLSNNGALAIVGSNGSVIKPLYPGSGTAAATPAAATLTQTQLLAAPVYYVTGLSTAGLLGICGTYGTTINTTTTLGLSSVPTDTVAVECSASAIYVATQTGVYTCPNSLGSSFTQISIPSSTTLNIWSLAWSANPNQIDSNTFQNSTTKNFAAGCLFIGATPSSIVNNGTSGTLYTYDPTPNYETFGTWISGTPGPSFSMCCDNNLHLVVNSGSEGLAFYSVVYEESSPQSMVIVGNPATSGTGLTQPAHGSPWGKLKSVGKIIFEVLDEALEVSEEAEVEAEV